MKYMKSNIEGSFDLGVLALIGLVLLIILIPPLIVAGLWIYILIPVGFWQTVVAMLFSIVLLAILFGVELSILALIAVFD